MIRLATEKDISTLNKICSDSSVWPWIVDDNTPENLRPEAGKIIFSIPNTFILTDGEFAAFGFQIINSILLEIHIAILPAGRGDYGLKQGLLAIEWVLKNTEFKKIIAFIPENNSRVLKYVFQCGFLIEGFSSKSFLKNGELIGQYIVGR